MAELCISHDSTMTHATISCTEEVCLFVALVNVGGVSKQSQIFLSSLYCNLIGHNCEEKKINC